MDAYRECKGISVYVHVYIYIYIDTYFKHQYEIGNCLLDSTPKLPLFNSGANHHKLTMRFGGGIFSGTNPSYMLGMVGPH